GRRLGPGRVLGLPPVRAIGRVSYSLYLVHWPILVLAPVALGIAPDDATNAILVGASVVVAAVLWAFVETPFRAGMPGLAQRPRRTLSIAMAAIVAVVVAAAMPAIVPAGGAAVVGAQPPTLDDAWPSSEPWDGTDLPGITPAPTTTVDPAPPGG